MTLAPLGGSKTSTPSKAEFREKAGAQKVLVSPRKSRVRKASDSSAISIKMMLFGTDGTGKTFTIKALLERGYKVAYITTDIGGDGLLGVRLACRREGQEKLLDNLFIIELNGDKEVQDFLKEPAAFFPEIYDVGIDFLFWDGYSSWQQLDLTAAIGENIEEEASNAASDGGKMRLVSDQRSKGNKFEQQDWGTLRQATVKAVDQFCTLNNKKTGQVWHKIFTCQESFRSKNIIRDGGKTSVLMEQMQPFLSGAGGIFSKHAFDLIIRTVVKTETDDDGAKRVFKYILQGNQTNTAKNRGFDFPPMMDANFGYLWDEICRQAGIQMGAVDENLKSEVLVSEGTE